MDFVILRKFESELRNVCFGFHWDRTITEHRIHCLHFDRHISLRSTAFEAFAILKILQINEIKHKFMHSMNILTSK